MAELDKLTAPHHKRESSIEAPNGSIPKHAWLDIENVVFSTFVGKHILGCLCDTAQTARAAHGKTHTMHEL